jgi:hypothetical protein
VIDKIEGLRPELQVDMLVNVELPPHSDIHLNEWEPANSISAF